MIKRQTSLLTSFALVASAGLYQPVLALSTRWIPLGQPPLTKGEAAFSRDKNVLERLAADVSAKSSGSDISQIRLDATPDRLVPKSKRSAEGFTPNLAPLELVETQEERSKRSVAKQTNESKQLTDLWNEAIQHNPDIRFIVQRLTPAASSQHKVAALMKLLSTAMYGGAFVTGLTANPAQSSIQRMAQTNGISLIQDLLGKAESKNSKGQLDDSQAVVLYGMIRGVGDRLRDCYFEYKRNVFLYGRAATEDADLRVMAGEMYDSLDPVKKIELHFVLRKSRRELMAIRDDVHRIHQALIELVGVDGTKKLDTQIDEEFASVEGHDFISTDLLNDSPQP